MVSLHDSRVLSIQSHVVSGYVGNKSAVFPLQLLGFEVDQINSVQFSNHTGYSTFSGQTLNDTDLMELYRGLSCNHINHYSHLLTGYVASDSFLRAIVKIVSDVKKVNCRLQYVCDPVLGDDGELYVPASLINIYRDEIIPISDVLTPNQYEAELLLDMKIEGMEGAMTAIRRLHSMGPSTVVLTSCSVSRRHDNQTRYHEEQSGCHGEEEEDTITSIASKIINGTQQCYMVQVPTLAAKFTGSGDLFTALFLAWNYSYGDDLKLTLETVASTMHSVLKNTLDHYLSSSKDHESRPPRVEEVELRLVQCKRLIEQPPPLFHASPLLPTIPT